MAEEEKEEEKEEGRRDSEEMGELNHFFNLNPEDLYNTEYQLKTHTHFCAN